MLGQGWGRIVNISSESVWLGNTSVQYATAKAALLGFTRSLARQLAPSGINVNAVAPGPVDTRMLRDLPPEHVEAERRTVLIGRFLDPAEIAATVAFLAGPGGDAYVGQVLSPNGGTVSPADRGSDGALDHRDDRLPPVVGEPPLEGQRAEVGRDLLAGDHRAGGRPWDLGVRGDDRGMDPDHEVPIARRQPAPDPIGAPDRSVEGFSSGTQRSLPTISSQAPLRWRVYPAGGIGSKTATP